MKAIVEMENRYETVADKSLHLTVHRVNGRRQQFVQTDSAAIWQIREQWRPERFFVQKQVMLAAQDSITVIPTDSIERVELCSNPLPDWQHPDNVADIEEISEDAFRKAQRAHLTPRPEPFIRPAGTLFPDPELVVLVEMRSGTTTYLRVRPNRRVGRIAPSRPLLTSDDMHLFLAHLFTRPVVFGKTEDGLSIFLLNPAHIDQFTLAPAPPRTVAGAWPMQKIAL